MISKSSVTIRIHTSQERWRYNIGIIENLVITSQLLAPSPEPPATIMADAEARADAYRELAGEKASKIDELQDEIKSLEKEIDRLGKIGEDSRHDNSGVNDGRINSSIASNNGSSSNGRDKRIQSANVDVINVEATFYTAFCPTGCIGITATGYDVSQTIYSPEGYRVIAVDPSQIPLNSIVEVSLADGQSFKAKALDTGGSIKGERIDVLVADRDEAYRLGRQKASVKIIERGR